MSLIKITMSYPEFDAKFYDKLNAKKEFLSLKLENDSPRYINPRFLDTIFAEVRRFDPQAHQRFGRNYVNPNTPYDRYLLKKMPGTGKTAESLLIAMEFINLYKQQYKINPRKHPYIFIIGFTKSIFQRELLTRPEFGFVSPEDIAERQKLQSLADVGTELDKQRLAEFRSRLKRRLSKPVYGGFFKFFGYKAFFNRLFIFKKDPSDYNSEDLIEKGIAAGDITLNQELVESFANSVIICDEIHDVYNSYEKNNYGIAIQKILDVYEIREEKLTAIFLSATPINNSPAEIVDLLNLLVSKHKFMRNDFFDDPRTLKPGALQKISNLLIGKVSFLRDLRLKYFPERIIEGDTIKSIPYLKFIRCEMSTLQYNTYKENYTGSLPPDGQSLVDFVVPNPASNKIGLFRTNNVKNVISSADRQWKNKIGIDIIDVEKSEVISGSYLEMKSLEKYSSKYYQLLNDIINSIGQGRKHIVYHQYVHMSGILHINQILSYNGFLEGNTTPTSNTRCIMCGVVMSKHDKSIKHDFRPARFLSVYSDIDKSRRNEIIAQFNAQGNAHGYDYFILTGSKVIQQSEDFKDVQVMNVMSAPPNIPTLIQIFGRAIRNKSHMNLPPEQRKVRIRLYVTSIPGEQTLSYEEIKYKENIADYKIIQIIEREINSVAVDAYINRDIIMPPSREKKLSTAPPEIGDLYFPPHKPKKMPLDDTTFKLYHFDEEIDNVSYIIKRLFFEQSRVWTEKDLWNTVRDPPFNTNFNPKYLSRESFIIALDRLTWRKNKSTVNLFGEPTTFITQFADKSVIIVDQKNNEYNISQHGKYYIMFPVLEEGVEKIPHVDVDNWYRPIEDTANTVLDITSYIQTLNLSYSKVKDQFIKRYYNFKIPELTTTIETYDERFHIHFLEDIIKYLFTLLTNPSSTMSEYHEFYIKMLYFYDKLNLVLFADQLESNPVLKDMYKEYVKPPDHIPDRNQFLITSLSKSSATYSKFDIKNLDKFVESIKKKKTKIVKVPANMLPVGHFLSSSKSGLRLFINGKWEDSPENIDIKPSNAKENDIIIGYLEKNPNSLHINFKLRPPIQKLSKKADARKNVRGSACGNKKKEELYELLKTLGLKLGRKDGIADICDKIKNELMRRELNERRKYARLTDEEKRLTKRIIWFYMHYETHLKF